MTAAPLRVPVPASLSAEAAAAPGRGHPLGMTGVPALPSSVAAAAMDDAQANADTAFVFSQYPTTSHAVSGVRRLPHHPPEVPARKDSITKKTHGSKAGAAGWGDRKRRV